MLRYTVDDSPTDEQDRAEPLDRGIPAEDLEGRVFLDREDLSTWNSSWEAKNKNVWGQSFILPSLPLVKDRASSYVVTVNFYYTTAFKQV